MNISEVVDVNDVQSVIRDNLEYQIKELVNDFDFLLDAVNFVNEGLLEYALTFETLDFSKAFYLKSSKDKDLLLNFLQGHGISLLDFSKAYSEYADEQDFVVVFPESQEFRFFDQHEIGDFLQESIPYLVDVAYHNLIGNILEEN